MQAIIHISREPIWLLDLCLFHFRNSYQDKSKFPVFVIGDGVRGDYPKVARKWGANWTTGEYLKGHYDRPLWTMRFARMALRCGHDWTLMLDPDARVWKRLTVPTSTALRDAKGKRVGTIGQCGQQIWFEKSKGTKCISGSASLYSRECCQKLLAIPASEYKSIWEERNEAARRDEYLKQAYKHDRWMPHLLKRIGMLTAETGEVFSLCGDDIGRDVPIGFNLDRRFAVTHPHKRIESWKDS